MSSPERQTVNQPADNSAPELRAMNRPAESSVTDLPVRHRAPSEDNHLSSPVGEPSKSLELNPAEGTLDLNNQPEADEVDMVDAPLHPPSIVPLDVDTTTDVFGNRYRAQREKELSERSASPPPSQAMTGIDPPPVTRKRGWGESNFRVDVLHAWFTADMCNRRLHQTEVPAPPENWQQMLEHPFAEEWMKAAAEELRALEEKHTWELVQLPKAKNVVVIPLKWTFSYKFDDEGYVIKYKGRLCVRGDIQKRYGIIGDTRALTLAIRTFRFMMALAAAFDLDIDQLDVSNAFLHAELSDNDEVYTQCAPGYQVSGKCYRLRRALYGMADSALRWQRHFEKKLVALGFKRISSEACIYTNGRITILYYVDDVALFSRKEHRKEVNELKAKLNKELDIRDCGELKWFLGIRIVRDRIQRKIWIVQDSYVDRIVHRFGLENRPRVSIPLSSIPSANQGPPASRKMQLEYLARVGSLLHPAIISRPDIASATSILASFSANPSSGHMALVERCIVYLRDHKFLALEFDGRIREPTDVELAFKGSSDASFADDLEIRRSTEGYLFKLFGGPIDWKSRKQQTVTTSTTEAELLALQHAAKEIQAWKHLFNEIEFDTEQAEDTLECDNRQSVRLITLDNPVIKTNIRHIHISELWIRQEQREGRINVSWVDTNRMEADGLTKPLPKSKFDKFVAQLGMRNIENRIV